MNSGIGRHNNTWSAEPWLLLECAKSDEESENEHTQEIRFIEKNSPQRTLALSDSGEGNFSISIFNEAGLIDIRQHRDGKFRVARFENDRLDVIDSTSFNELATKSPKMVKDWLFPLLKHYGIDPPLTADSESEK